MGNGVEKKTASVSIPVSEVPKSVEHHREKG